MAVATRRKNPPASRATTPPATGGRHRAAPRSIPRRVATGAASTARRDVAPAARSAYRAGNRAATFTTQRSKGGQHALMAEFLLFAGIVALRAIADYVPSAQGTATEGTGKGSITPREGQLGPLPVLAAGFVVFFVLSFLAARGGTWARVAAVSGLIIDTALLMKSLPELGKVSQAFGTVSQPAAAAPPAAPGSAPSPAEYTQPA
jgi:hypothetical protein